MSSIATSKRNLIWIDGLGGLLVGVLVLIAADSLFGIYGLPARVLIFSAMANLVYGSFSTWLAAQRNRPPKLIALLSIMNLAWPIVCAVIVVLYRESISIFGFGHLLAEAIYVGGLGWLEWRWRHFLK